MEIIGTGRVGNSARVVVGYRTRSKTAALLEVRLPFANFSPQPPMKRRNWEMPVAFEIEIETVDYCGN